MTTVVMKIDGFDDLELAAHRPLETCLAVVVKDVLAAAEQTLDLGIMLGTITLICVFLTTWKVNQRRAVSDVQTASGGWTLLTDGVTFLDTAPGPTQAFIPLYPMAAGH